jgi:FlaA1/EpsC-like NDP-sugar epimerase
VLIGERPIRIEITGIRPGEKVHEIMVSDEEAPRTLAREDWYAIQPMLPEVAGPAPEAPALAGQFSSADHLLSPKEIRGLLAAQKLLVEAVDPLAGELLR